MPQGFIIDLIKVFLLLFMIMRWACCQQFITHDIAGKKAVLFNNIKVFTLVAVQMV